MDIKQRIGEISGANLINPGDRISVKYYDKNNDNKARTDEGILIKATPQKIIINGTTARKEIDVEKIIEIKKV
ncbi:hypothetical protein J4443_00510 [Candidatus Woesearchaeota archaeon]|nr:hypothetical protein [Candidatus Woesearchaeota archaeon]